ncbi:MAG: hypothetical protein JW818_11850 [Pirellulales bacterium]|nr:hypothetical protein [Pirellulales bacterium]
MKFRDVIILLPCHSIEDLSLEQDEQGSAEMLSTWSAAFHPALVCSSGRTPRWMGAEQPPEGAELSEAIVLVPGISETALPKGWSDTVPDAGGVLVRGLADRDAMVAALLELVDVDPEHVDPAHADPELTADMLALGFCQLQVELVTRQLRYMSSLDEGQFETESVRAAERIMQGDLDTAREHLQSAFDLLIEAREYFYPATPDLIDLTLVAPTTLGESLRRELQQETPINLLISGATLEEMARREPDSLAALRAAWKEGRVTVIGGSYDDRPFALLGFESVLATFRQGLRVYEDLLGRRPVVFGRRQSALWPGLPDVAAGLGFKAALHFALDGSRFPAENQSRIQWEGQGGTKIDALARPPSDAARNDTFLTLPERLGEIMDLDHSPTAVFAHWPGGARCWHDDLKRIARYASVLGRFVGLEETFDETDSVGQVERHTADAYPGRSLAQAVEAGQVDPISRWVRHHHRRAALDTCNTLTTLATLLRSEEPPSNETPDDLAAKIDTAVGHEDQSDSELDDRLARRLDHAVDAMVEVLSGPSDAAASGSLVLNPWSFARSYPINSSTAPADLAALSMAEVPPLGFRWIGPEGVPQPAPKQPSQPARLRKRCQTPFVQSTRRAVPAKGAWHLFRRWRRKPDVTPSMVEGAKLRNEYFEIELDPITGALRRLDDFRSHGNRLGAQLALRTPPRTPGASGTSEADYTIMAADEVSSSIPGLGVGQIESRGRLVDREGRTVAQFAQTFRARRGSRVIEWHIELQPERLPEGSPWQSYYTARIAWNAPGAELFRSVNLVSHPTGATALESPYYVDIRSERTATTILGGGLPYYRQSGEEKLDAILIVAGERARRFRLGLGIDLLHPALAALDFLAPTSGLIRQTPSPTIAQGWFFHLDARNVVATAWEPIWPDGSLPTGGPSPTGVRVRLLETEGLSTSLTLRGYRSLASAQQTDLTGQPTGPLPVEDDRLHLELRPRQWVQIEAIFRP